MGGIVRARAFEVARQFSWAHVNAKFPRTT